MPLLIRLKNNEERYVSSQVFNDLLAEDEIIAFKRSTGDWVDPKVGPLRGAGPAQHYHGPERRGRW